MINVKHNAIRKLSPGTLSSFHVKVDKGENLLNELHYHPEVELILLKRSAGKMVVGNRECTFEGDEVLLLGSNLPHLFMHDHLQDYTSVESAAEALVIQFDEGFLGDKFMGMPEVKSLQALFIQARNGIRVSAQARDNVIRLMEQIPGAPSFTRIVLLLEILSILVDGDACRLIAGEPRPVVINDVKDVRLKKVLDYTRTHYMQNIKLEEIAAVINLTRESFCRFFKSHTGKTYVEYLIEYRISQACKMLIDSDMSAKEIGFYIGYENLSHFYTQFKKLVSMSPLDFRSRHLSILE